jgi:nitroimidazol reductase NimA-like FMN-containing flavoprotein (pyridoxamine 5'-phosphate oxidase superfamily)
MPVPLTKDEAYEYLDTKPHAIILTTIGRDGFPHSVPIGYFRFGEDIYVGGRAGTQKIKNAQRNPRVSVLLETGGGTLRELKGLMVQGEAEVITEPKEVLVLMREVARQRGTPEEKLPAEPRPGTAYIRIKPRRFISWDYSREG